MIRIHSFESMGTFDGPGLRLVVFMQGCNFKCLYCANPDTIDAKGGREADMQEIVQMAERERPFFGRRGGVTFSGGEPLMQAANLLPIVKELQSRGLHVCIDTNGSIISEAAIELLKTVDLSLVDVKHIEEDRHSWLTGLSNKNTLQNIAFLQENMRPLWVRYVFVPGFNSDEYTVRLWGEKLSKFSMIQRVELLPYHTLGMHKYEALGWEYKMKDTAEPSRTQMQEAQKILQEYFTVPVVIN